MTKRKNHLRVWIAWAITLGETLLLVAFGVVLSRWLMLPVWLRAIAVSGLILAFAIIAYRFFKFRRTQKTQGVLLKLDSARAIKGEAVGAIADRLG